MLPFPRRWEVPGRGPAQRGWSPAWGLLAVGWVRTPAASVHPRSPARAQQGPGDKPVSCRGLHSAPDTRKATGACLTCEASACDGGPQPLPEVTSSLSTSGNRQALPSLESCPLLVKSSALASSGPRHKQPPVCPSSPVCQVQGPHGSTTRHLPRGRARSALPVTPPVFLPLDGVLPWGRTLLPPPLR